MFRMITQAGCVTACFLCWDGGMGRGGHCRAWVPGLGAGGLLGTAPSIHIASRLNLLHLVSSIQVGRRLCACMQFPHGQRLQYHT